jgi:hypothetical protein
MYLEAFNVAWWDWIVWVTLFTLYITALFTVALLTFRKGRIVLGIVGIFFPFLWLIGAILPAKEGSQYQVNQAYVNQQRIQEYSQ